MAKFKVWASTKYVGSWKTRKKAAADIADRVCPDGWIADHYFNSQNSFYYKDGQTWARTTIRRWVDKEI